MIIQSFFLRQCSRRYLPRCSSSVPQTQFLMMSWEMLWKTNAQRIILRVLHTFCPRFNSCMTWWIWVMVSCFLVNLCWSCIVSRGLTSIFSHRWFFWWQDKGIQNPCCLPAISKRIHWETSHLCSSQSQICQNWSGNSFINAQSRFHWLTSFMSYFIVF